MAIEDITKSFSLADVSASSAGTHTFAVDTTFTIPDGEVWYLDDIVIYGHGYSENADTTGSSVTRDHRVVVALSGRTTSITVDTPCTFAETATENTHNITNTATVDLGFYVHGSIIDAIQLYHEIYINGSYNFDTYSQDTEGYLTMRRVL